MSCRNQVPHGWMRGHVFKVIGPSLNEVLAPAPKGSMVRVTMTSRFGDCGITPDLDAERGYISRILPENLERIPGKLYDLIPCDCRLCVNRPKSGASLEN